MRTYTTKRGESLHGIAKRLTGDLDPVVLLDRVDDLRRRNGFSEFPRFLGNETIIIPDSFPAEPKVDTESSAGQQRLKILALTERDAMAKIAQDYRAALVMAARAYIQAREEQGYQPTLAGEASCLGLIFAALGVQTMTVEEFHEQYDDFDQHEPFGGEPRSHEN